jgi:hypothetical protein
VTFVEGYPKEPYVGGVYEQADPKFEQIKRAEMAEGDHQWGLFADEDEWDLWWNIQVCFLASASAISQITNDVEDRENWTQEGQLHQ